jgi:hypothetical protein
MRLKSSSQSERQGGKLERLGQVAVKSKQQGDAVDYRVIALSHGPLTAEDFEVMYRELSVGAVRHNAETIGESAPWFTIGSFVNSDRRYLAAVRQDWTDRHDIRSRPVVAQYCLCLPDTVLSEQSPSYRNLCANIPPQQYFFGAQKESLDDPKLEFQPVGAEVTEILRSISEIGFDFCSFVASMLLASPVAIISGHELSVETRLSFFDAVASLLPYGSRTDLGVSTWMNSTTVSKIHLGFSDAVLPNQKRVVWRETATKELELSPVAQNYYTLLHRLWEEPHADWEQIISDLASKRNPFTFNEPHHMLNALREVNWEKRVYEEVKSEQGKKAEVRELLTAKQRSKLNKEQVNDLLLFLLEEKPLELEDIKILRANWDESFWVPACELVKKELQYPIFQDEVLWALCSVAAEKDWLEKFLDALLQPEMLKSLAPTLSLFNKATHKFEYDKSRVIYFLMRDYRFLYEFLFMVGGNIETHAELGPWLSSLREDEPPKNLHPPRAFRLDLKAFQIAFGSVKEHATVEMIESLAKANKSYVEQLFRIAMTKLHLTRDNLAIWHLTDAISSWLLGHLPSLGKDEARQWAEHLRLMYKGPHPSTNLKTRLDVISLALRAENNGLLLSEYMEEETHEEIIKYAEAFIHNTTLSRFGSQQIISGLITYLNSLTLSSNGASNDMYLVSGIISKVREEHVKNFLISHLGRNIKEHPSLIMHEAFALEIKDKLLNWGKGERLLEILYSAFAEAVRKKVPVEQAVEFYLQMFELQMPQLVEKVTAAFYMYSYLDNQSKIETFIEILRDALEQTLETPEMVAEQIFVLQKALMSIKSEPMSQYHKKYVTEMIAALTTAKELLELTADGLAKEQAEEIRQLIEKMREHLPAPRFFSFIGGSGKRNDKTS